MGWVQRLARYASRLLVFGILTYFASGLFGVGGGGYFVRGVGGRVAYYGSRSCCCAGTFDLSFSSF